MPPAFSSDAGQPSRRAKASHPFPTSKSTSHHSHLSSTPWLPMSSTCNHCFYDFIKQLLLFCILTTTSLLYHGKYFSSVSWQVLLFCIMATTSLLYHGNYFSSISWQVLLFCILIMAINFPAPCSLIRFPCRCPDFAYESSRIDKFAQITPSPRN